MTPAQMKVFRRAGRKGGHARAAKLTPDQRRDIARKASAARWLREKALA
jgi:hypothetical protein